MTKKSQKTPKALKKMRPVRSSSHQKEDKSKRAFEEIIEPFFVNWNQKDYGIDGIVDITSHSEHNGDVELESKCFLAQLKSTDELSLSGDTISFVVPVKKILFWYDYNLPVLFALYSLQERKFYFIWINDALIASLDSERPDWNNQKEVTIKLASKSVLDKSTLDPIKSYVFKWKVPARREMEPGQYFQLKNKGVSLINEYKDLTEKFGFDSVNETIKCLENDADQSIYRVALTGLSRVGKSSLINALLKKEVSPTGFFQTTGVPIQVIPGTQEQVTVFFHDKPSVTKPFSLNVIKRYASQDLNEDNKERVKLVSISVKNRNLERGVSLFDIPGLDDPNDDILEYTWQTVRKANAIIYVIDATPAQNGGFIFKNEYKKHITTFNQSQDKVFLVFNKVDGLTPEKLALLKERVVFDLKKHKLYDSIGAKIFFLSAESKGAHQNIDSIDHLNEELWSFILKENKFGIVKLSFINQELFKNTKTFTQILKSRLLDNEKRQQLETSISQVKNRLPSLSQMFRKQKEMARQLIYAGLDSKKNAILYNLEQSLKKVPVNKDLPNSAAIKKYLIDSLNQTLDQTNNEYVLQVNQLKHLIDRWIDDNLKQVTEILSADQKKIVDFTEVEAFEAPQIDLRSAWGMGFIGVVAGLILAIPGAALIGGLLGFFGNLFTSAESRRAKRISRIMESSREKCDVVFEKIKSGYSDLINEHSISIDNYVTRKLNTFFSDLQGQMAKLSTPIKAAEKNLYDEAFEKIDKFQEKLTDFDAELRSYHFGRS